MINEKDVLNHIGEALIKRLGQLFADGETEEFNKIIEIIPVPSRIITEDGYVYELVYDHSQEEWSMCAGGDLFISLGYLFEMLAMDKEEKEDMIFPNFVVQEWRMINPVNA